jgi:hypothetical protein
LGNPNVRSFHQWWASIISRKTGESKATVNKETDIAGGTDIRKDWVRGVFKLDCGAAIAKLEMGGEPLPRTLVDRPEFFDIDQGKLWVKDH